MKIYRFEFIDTSLEINEGEYEEKEKTYRRISSNHWMNSIIKKSEIDVLNTNYGLYGYMYSLSKDKFYYFIEQVINYNNKCIKNYKKNISRIEELNKILYDKINEILYKRSE